MWKSVCYDNIARKLGHLTICLHVPVLCCVRLSKHSLIGKLMIGYLDTGVDQDSDEEHESGASYDLPPRIASNNNNDFAVPAPRGKR